MLAAGPTLPVRLPDALGLTAVGDGVADDLAAGDAEVEDFAGVLVAELADAAFSDFEDSVVAGVFATVPVIGGVAVPALPTLLVALGRDFVLEELSDPLNALCDPKLPMPSSLFTPPKPFKLLPNPPPPATPNGPAWQGESKAKALTILIAASIRLPFMSYSSN